MSNDETVTIDYTNYKGIRAPRLIIPKRIFLGSTKFHPERQYILQAYDVGRGEAREFAMKDIHSWGQVKAVGVDPIPLPPKELERF